MQFVEDLKVSLIEELKMIEDAEGNTLTEENYITLERFKNWISNFEEGT